MTDQLLTVDDLRARWQKGSRYVYRVVQERRIGFLRIGRELRFRLADVEAFENANRSEAQTSPVANEVPPRVRLVAQDANRRRSGSPSGNGGGARQAVGEDIGTRHA